MPDIETSGTLGKAAIIVNTLSLHGELSPAALAVATGIPRSSVYRMLGGLAECGLVVMDDDSTAALSLKWVQMADAARRSMTEWAPIASRLAAITKACGMTSFLSVRRGDQTVCIEWEQGTGIDALILRPGRTLPLYAGAVGRAALARLNDEDLERYLGGAPFHPYNRRTLTSRQSLLDDIATTRRRGYALSQEDVTPGVGAVGIAVDDPVHTGTVGCVSVGGLIAEITERHVGLAALLHSEVDAALAA